MMKRFLILTILVACCATFGLSTTAKEIFTKKQRWDLTYQNAPANIYEKMEIEVEKTIVELNKINALVPRKTLVDFCDELGCGVGAVPCEPIYSPVECPVGTSFSATFDKCMVESSKRCPEGYTQEELTPKLCDADDNNSYGTDNILCVKAPDCPTGTDYDPDMDICKGIHVDLIQTQYVYSCPDSFSLEGFECCTTESEPAAKNYVCSFGGTLTSDTNTTPTSSNATVAPTTSTTTSTSVAATAETVSACSYTFFPTRGISTSGTVSVGNTAIVAYWVVECHANGDISVQFDGSSSSNSMIVIASGTSGYVTGLNDYSSGTLTNQTRFSGNYSCPNGSTLVGNMCETTVETKSCPSGYALSADKTTCTSVDINLTCPNGSELVNNESCQSGIECEKTCQNPPYCPNGGTLVGTTCSKTCSYTATTINNNYAALWVPATSYTATGQAASSYAATSSIGPDRVFTHTLHYQGAQAVLPVPKNTVPKSAVQYVYVNGVTYGPYSPLSLPGQYYWGRSSGEGGTGPIYYDDNSNTYFNYQDGTYVSGTVRPMTEGLLVITYGGETIYSCPSGGTLSGTTCNIASTLSCPSGGTLSGTTCTLPGYYTCPSGGTLNGATCLIPNTYTCPSGGSLNGTTCQYDCSYGATPGAYYACNYAPSLNLSCPETQVRIGEQCLEKKCITRGIEKTCPINYENNLECVGTFSDKWLLSQFTDHLCRCPSQAEYDQYYLLLLQGNGATLVQGALSASAPANGEIYLVNGNCTELKSITGSPSLNVAAYEEPVCQGDFPDTYIYNVFIQHLCRCPSQAEYDYFASRRYTGIPYTDDDILNAIKRTALANEEVWKEDCSGKIHSEVCSKSTPIAEQEAICTVPLGFTLAPKSQELVCSAEGEATLPATGLVGLSLEYNRCEALISPECPATLTYPPFASCGKCPTYYTEAARDTTSITCNSNIGYGTILEDEYQSLHEGKFLTTFEANTHVANWNGGKYSTGNYHFVVDLHSHKSSVAENPYYPEGWNKWKVYIPKGVRASFAMSVWPNGTMRIHTKFRADVDNIQNHYTPRDVPSENPCSTQETRQQFMVNTASFYCDNEETSGWLYVDMVEDKANSYSEHPDYLGEHQLYIGTTYHITNETLLAEWKNSTYFLTPGGDPSADIQSMNVIDLYDEVVPATRTIALAYGGARIDGTPNVQNCLYDGIKKDGQCTLKVPIECSAMRMCGGPVTDQNCASGGVYSQDSDACANNASCPIGNFECNGPTPLFSFCSPYGCNSDNRCGYAYCDEGTSPSPEEPFMERQYFDYFKNELNGQCNGDKCDLVLNKDITYCKSTVCPTGFGIYEQDGKCLLKTCPAGSVLKGDDKCYKIACPSGTIEQPDGSCLGGN